MSVIGVCLTEKVSIQSQAVHMIRYNISVVFTSIVIRQVTLDNTIQSRPLTSFRMHIISPKRPHSGGLLWQALYILCNDANIEEYQINIFD